MSVIIDLAVTGIGEYLSLSQLFLIPIIDPLLDGPKAAWEEKMSKHFAVVDASASSTSTGEGDATQRLTKATTMQFGDSLIWSSRSRTTLHLINVEVWRN